MPTIRSQQIVPQDRATPLHPIAAACSSLAPVNYTAATLRSPSMAAKHAAGLTVTLRRACYALGVATSLTITATSAVITGMHESLFEEIGPVAFMFVLIFLPFAVLPSRKDASKRRLVVSVLTTFCFWTIFLFLARRSKGGVNFGLAFVTFLSPILIWWATRVIERFFGSKEKPEQVSAR